MVIGVALALQRQATITLRRELAQVRSNTAGLERLRAENRRLRDNQISAAELARLRANHTSLQRLWSELDALTKKPPMTKP
jgi:ABC-type phosphate transport system auxiliary subunit